MELLESDHVLSSLQIVGDAVGWGFVVRGSKPCHIQAVDPSGPAAAAGMKVGSQNGIFVLLTEDLGLPLFGEGEVLFFPVLSAFLSQFQTFVHSEFCCL